MSECKDKPTCMSRRDFLVRSGFIAGSAVLTVSALSTSVLAKNFDALTIDLTSNSALSKAGGSQVVDSSAGKIIVINEGGGKFAAFSARCTHKGYILDYDPVGKRLVCDKHGSTFDDRTGAVTNGPARDPLPAYPAAEKGSDVTISIS